MLQFFICIGKYSCRCLLGGVCGISCLVCPIYWGWVEKTVSCQMIDHCSVNICTVQPVGDSASCWLIGHCHNAYWLVNGRPCDVLVDWPLSECVLLSDWETPCRFGSQVTTLSVSGYGRLDGLLVDWPVGVCTAHWVGRPVPCWLIGHDTICVCTVQVVGDLTSCWLTGYSVLVDWPLQNVCCSVRGRLHAELVDSSLVYTVCMCIFQVMGDFMYCGLTGHCHYVYWSVYRRPDVLSVDWSLSVCVLVSVQEA